MNSNPFHPKMLLKSLYSNDFKDRLANFYWTVVKILNYILW